MAENLKISLLTRFVQSTEIMRKGKGEKEKKKKYIRERKNDRRQANMSSYTGGVCSDVKRRKTIGMLVGIPRVRTMPHLFPVAHVD